MEKKRIKLTITGDKKRFVKFYEEELQNAEKNDLKLKDLSIDDKNEIYSYEFEKIDLTKDK